MSVRVRVSLGFRDRVSVSVTVCIFQLFGVWGLALGISLAYGYLRVSVWVYG